jgi:hypothetical protein
MAHKDDIATKVEPLLVKLNALDMTVKKIRCDNSGENKALLQPLCEKLGINVEYTPANNPQYNGVVERAFVTIRQRAVASLNESRLEEVHRRVVWAEAINTATVLANATKTGRRDLPADTMFYNEPSKIYEAMQPFGRIGFVTDKTKIKAKLDDRSFKQVLLCWVRRQSCEGCVVPYV